MQNLTLHIKIKDDGAAAQVKSEKTGGPYAYVLAGVADDKKVCY